ncbi:helix-turn-helix transcriptional regulator [Micromonospora peucetia]|uniref:helix-turn-helix transcriptional regulator n=1 Tax=Micromonospora peucetia TaxID=47871 RepID=UPI00331BC0D4
MLEVLGLHVASEAVYRVMLEEPRYGVAEIAARLSWTTEQVHEALDELGRLSLLRASRDEPGAQRAISPEVGLPALLARQETELAMHQEKIAASRRAVAAIVADYAELRPAQSRAEVEQLASRDSVRHRLEELVHSCRTEILSFVPGGAQCEETSMAARSFGVTWAERGIQARGVYLDSVRNHPPTLHHLRRLHEQRVQIRTTAALPLQMTIFDREIALVPIDSEQHQRGAALHHGRGTVAALCALFEQTWRAAHPLGAERDRDESGLTSQEREVLHLLAEGHTDDSVARRLGISVRTGRRITADLLKRLGARSRFQAGALAAARGWIDAA